MAYCQIVVSAVQLADLARSQRSSPPVALRIGPRHQTQTKADEAPRLSSQARSPVCQTHAAPGGSPQLWQPVSPPIVRQKIRKPGEPRPLRDHWCERGDSNSHGQCRWILSPVRLPVPPLSHAEPLEWTAKRPHGRLHGHGEAGLLRLPPSSESGARFRRDSHQDIREQ